MDIVALTTAAIAQQDSRDHPIRLITSEEPVLATLDSDRMEQVLTNLIGNACKYSAPGTEVVVGIERRHAPDEIVGWVRDHGIGIDKDAQTRIFDQFYRAQNPDVQRIEGLGLGLYISHDIVTRHGGRMWVESEPGVGSTFYWAIPPAPPPLPVTESEVSEQDTIS